MIDNYMLYDDVVQLTVGQIKAIIEDVLKVVTIFKG